MNPLNPSLQASNFAWGELILEETRLHKPNIELVMTAYYMGSALTAFLLSLGPRISETGKTAYGFFIGSCNPKQAGRTSRTTTCSTRSKPGFAPYLAGLSSLSQVKRS
ncbi:MAG: hypothetical protein R3B74_09010 [Nitrospirales bacterium]|nr:hypothetical protein [Nitrospirales bacterium]